MARPPKPKGLLLLSGAGRKDPKRMAARANEPEPPSLNIGEPPAKWKLIDAMAMRAEMLFAEEKTLNEVAAELGITWEHARELRVQRSSYAEWEKLRAIWYECAAMWPWNTFSERHTLERYCNLKFKEDEGKLNNTEKRLIQSLCVELGGTGGGRAKLGGVLAPNGPLKGKDSRSQLLARKYG
jgi:hypothetical protein